MISKRSKLLLLLRYLLEQSDEMHPRTLQEIKDYLSTYEIEVNRRTLYEDMEQLRALGFDVQMVRNEHFCYFIGNRDFQLPEIKMLIDAVQAAPFLTAKKSMELIGKLSTLTSKEQAKQLNKHIYVLNQARTTNESIYYTVDGISTAINENKKILFRYFDYSVDGTKVYRHEGEPYLVNPVALCVDRYYYLVAYDTLNKDYRHYRVDRMESLDISFLSRDPIPENFDLGSYSKKVFSMYSGQNTVLYLRFQDHLLNSVIDRFGTNNVMHASTPGCFDITVEVEVGPTFYGWLFQFETQAEILNPPSVRDDYAALCQNVANTYSSTK